MKIPQWLYKMTDFRLTMIKWDQACMQEIIEHKTKKRKFINSNVFFCAFSYVSQEDGRLICFLISHPINM